MCGLQPLKCNVLKCWHYIPEHLTETMKTIRILQAYKPLKLESRFMVLNVPHQLLPVFAEGVSEQSGFVGCAVLQPPLPPHSLSILLRCPFW
jgi:hypothetical protein